MTSEQCKVRSVKGTRPSLDLSLAEYFERHYLPGLGKISVQYRNQWRHMVAEVGRIFGPDRPLVLYDRIAVQRLTQDLLARGCKSYRIREQVRMLRRILETLPGPTAGERSSEQ